MPKRGLGEANIWSDRRVERGAEISHSRESSSGVKLEKTFNENDSKNSNREGEQPFCSHNQCPMWLVLLSPFRKGGNRFRKDKCLVQTCEGIGERNPRPNLKDSLCSVTCLF